MADGTDGKGICMKFAISNIAWPQNQEKEIFSVISHKGFCGVEIAPSRIWKDFRDITAAERIAYKKYVGRKHLEICSMHSLFYGTQGLGIFGQTEERRNFVMFFRALIDLASDLEVPRMVFGSPSTRKRNGMPFEQAVSIAANVLYPVAEYAYQRGTKILIEPLSPEETDFIENHKEGLALVGAVGSKGFGLHLDAKALSAEQEAMKDIFEECNGYFEHFHVNEERLGSFKEPLLPHESIARELKKSNYSGYVSIEMRELENPKKEIETAMDFVRSVYGETA